MDRAKRLVLDDKYYGIATIKSGMISKGEIDGNTVAWWMMQSTEARTELFGDSVECQPIEAVLKGFSAWIREQPLCGIWGNGASFDNVVLENCYRRLGWTPPWTYKQNRCYRTMVSEWTEVKREDKAINRIAHHALSDAEAQAEHLTQIWEHIYGIKLRANNES